MSKGAGKIERIVEHSLKDTDRSFTIEELCHLAYSDIASVEKKHRVSVLRSVKNLQKRLKSLWWWDTERPPWRLIIVDSANTRSWIHGLLRSYHHRNGERSLEEIDRILNDQTVQAHMKPGGPIWAQLEIYRIEAAMQDFKIPNGTLKSEAPPEYNELGERVTNLRYYFHNLTGNYSLDYYDYFRRFEPPDSHSYKYAMEHPYLKKEPSDCRNYRRSLD